jgi:uncharacterized protein
MINHIMEKLILGTVQFGLKYGINNKLGKPSREEVFKILDFAFRSGIKILDTAESYGNSHQIIGDYHKERRRNKFKINTKLPEKLNQKNIEFIVIKFLRDLNVKNIETLMFHSFQSYYDFRDKMRSFNAIKNNQLVKNIGVSVYTNEQVEFLIKEDRVNLVQLPFNLFDNKLHRGEVIKKLKNSGKIIHIRSAFLQGLFFKSGLENVYPINKLKNELRELKKLSKKYNVNISSMALSYCLAQQNVEKVLMGVDSKLQLSENIKSVQLQIDKELVEEIDSINIVNKNLLNPSKWP